MTIKVFILFLVTLFCHDRSSDTLVIKTGEGKKKETGTEYKLLKIDNNIYVTG